MAKFTTSLDNSESILMSSETTLPTSDTSFETSATYERLNFHLHENENTESDYPHNNSTKDSAARYKHHDRPEYIITPVKEAMFIKLIYLFLGKKFLFSWMF